MIRNSRLDRQMRIEGWSQAALDDACIGVVGDDDLLASFFALSASALGVNKLVVLAPVMDRLFVEIAHKVNPFFVLTHIEGFYTHPALDDMFKGCSLIVDLGHYGLATKLLLEKGFRERIPIVRGFCYERNGIQGLNAFTYMRGREWLEIEQIVCLSNLPSTHFDDGVLDSIVAGIVLEEVKNILMRLSTSDALISYERSAMGACGSEPKIMVVGAGALGTFVGLGLACSGYRHCTFMDPDVVEETNLNRQILFYEAFGKSKAEALSARLNDLFGMCCEAVASCFEKSTDLSPYDVIFDCVDSFEARILLSEKCREEGKVLISGGTSVNAGQVVVYDPMKGGPAPAELLGLHKIVSTREAAQPLREKASCTYQPVPSVIMTNQIIGGFMVDSYRKLHNGQEPGNIFYDSTSSGKVVAEGLPSD